MQRSMHTEAPNGTNGHTNGQVNGANGGALNLDLDAVM